MTKIKSKIEFETDTQLFSVEMETEKLKCGCGEPIKFIIEGHVGASCNPARIYYRCKCGADFRGSIWPV